MFLYLYLKITISKITNKYQPLFICDIVLFLNSLYYVFLHWNKLCFLSSEKGLYNSQPYSPFLSGYLLSVFSRAFRCFLKMFGWWIFRHFSYMWKESFEKLLLKKLFKKIVNYLKSIWKPLENHLKIT